MTSLRRTFYPGHKKMVVSYVDEETVVIDGSTSSFYKSSQPLSKTDIGCNLTYAGTISISENFKFTGPLIVVGRHERNGDFRVSNELLNQLNCKPYVDDIRESVIINETPCFMIIETIKK
jgi:hypothetical protein